MDEEKIENAFRMLVTEGFYQWMKFEVLCAIVESQLSPDRRGLFKSSYNHYPQTDGDAAFRKYYEHLRTSWTISPDTATDGTAEDMQARSDDPLWEEFRRTRIEQSQELADHEWRRLWGAL